MMEHVLLMLLLQLTRRPAFCFDYIHVEYIKVIQQPVSVILTNAMSWQFLAAGDLVNLSQDFGGENIVRVRRTRVVFFFLVKGRVNHFF